jgi:hypothetical protein
MESDSSSFINTSLSSAKAILELHLDYTWMSQFDALIFIADHRETEIAAFLAANQDTCGKLIDRDFMSDEGQRK